MRTQGSEDTLTHSNDQMAGSGSFDSFSLYAKTFGLLEFPGLGIPSIFLVSLLRSRSRCKVLIDGVSVVLFEQHQAQNEITVVRGEIVFGQQGG